MGLFGGKSEEELRASGTPTTARVTYVDDTGKRRDDGAQAQASRSGCRSTPAPRAGASWRRPSGCRSTRMPRMGEHVQIRFDPDDVDDWAWGDAAMYSPPRAPSPLPSAPVPVPPAQPQAFDPFAGMGGLQQMIATAFAQGNVMHSNQVIDLTGNPELREQMLGQLRAYGVDIDAMQAATNSVGMPAPAPGEPAGSVDETAVKLKQLDELHRQGILTAEEHREQRQRIIDSI